jgi:hypothetical protein
MRSHRGRVIASSRRVGSARRPGGKGPDRDRARHLIGITPGKAGMNKKPGAAGTQAASTVLITLAAGQFRYLHVLGVNASDGPWTTQQARNLVINLGGQVARFRSLVRDQAGQFTASFDAVMANAGIEVVKIPPRCPHANCYPERLVLRIRAEVTDRILIFGERHLRRALARYSMHYNRQRPHRALYLRPPRLDAPVPDAIRGRIRRRPILGGLINEYEAAA